MADWLAPFHLPKFTDEQFEKQHRAYVKKHGYTVTFPSLTDIIHLDYFPPLTEREKKLWTGSMPMSDRPRVPRTGAEIGALLKAGKKEVSASRPMTNAELKNSIPKDRRSAIAVEKKRKKDRFAAMLATPSPEILRSAGAMMTALDDTQDAISTLGSIGLIAAKVLGGTAAAVLEGPAGWLMGAATLMSMINPQSWIKNPLKRTKGGRAKKRELEDLTDKNPFSKKARVKWAKNLRRIRPSTAIACEALQVTQSIFGVGISLGPIMGLAQDLLSGLARQITGAQVSWSMPPPPYPKHVYTAMKALKAQSLLHGTAWKSDVSEEVQSMIAANLALQVVTPYVAEWNPAEQVNDIANVVIDAPRPTDVLTKEVIAEAGFREEDICNWPQNGSKAISLDDLMDKTAPQAAKNLTTFAQTNKHDPVALVGAQNAHDYALGSIIAIEGPGSVTVDYSHTERTVITILMCGWCYPDDITPAQVQKFEDWVYTHEYMSTQPSGKDIWRYAEVFCGFRWASSPE